MAADPGSDQRLQLNHPNAVLRRWQAARHPATEDGPGTGRRPGLREEVLRLQSELDAAQREIGRLRRTSTTATMRLAGHAGRDRAAMLRRYPSKAKRVGAAILALSKATAKKPRAGG